MAIYLFFLAFLNGKPRATVFSGAWDFTCLLLGLSGFIILGGPLLLTLFDSAWCSVWLTGSFSRIRSHWDTYRFLWLVVPVVYLTFLTCAIVYILQVRRKVTIVYNLEPSEVEETFLAAADSLQIPHRRVLGGIELGSRDKKPEGADPGPFAPSLETTFVRIDFFAAMRHATVRWHDPESPLRRELEPVFTRMVMTPERPSNPIAGWFMTGAVSIFLVMLVWLGFLIYVIMV